MIEDLANVQRIIGYEYKEQALLLRAFTHDSGIKKGSKKSYQNLEFLGDSILNFVIAEALMHRHPSFDEGQLTRMRAAVVSEKPLAETIRRLGLNSYLIMGVSETRMGINNNSSVMGDLYEAIVASIYLDGGLRQAKRFILSSLEPVILKSECNNNNFYDYKSMLNEFAGKHNLQVKYVNVNDEFIDNRNKFTFEIAIDGDVLGKGTGNSKKEAQQMAAKIAYKKLIKASESDEADKCGKR